MTLAQRIRELREKHGWTMEQLADKAGMTKANVFYLEKGTTTDPRLSSLLGLIDAFGITLKKLLEGIDGLDQ